MRLSVKSGERAGTSVEITATQLVIGREEGCDLVLPDDEISRRHASVRALPDGRTELTDLGSRNGTYVNGSAIQGSVALAGGEEIRFGQTTLSAEAGAGAGATEVADLGATEVAPAPPAQPPAAAPPPPAAPPPAAPPGQPPAAPPPGPAPQPVAAATPSAIRRVIAADSGIRRMLERSRRNTILASVAAGLAIVAVILLATGVFSGSPPSASEIVARAKPSTVLISAVSDGQDLGGAGTGWVLDAEEGLIVTNYHVTAVGDTMRVGVDGQNRDADFVGVAPCEDLALLRVSDTSGLRTMPLGSQSDIEQGDRVVALGFPSSASSEEILQTTVGSVSSVGGGADLVEPSLPIYENVVQTDAAINPGNSGGPLVNDDGELVGVNTLGGGQGGIENQGYAVGVDRVKEVMSRMQRGEGVLWLGLGFESDGTRLVTSSAARGTSANDQGLNDQFLVRSVNGQAVSDLPDYCEAVEGGQPGDTAALELQDRLGRTARVELPFE